MSKLMRGTALALLLAAVACEDSQAPRPVRVPVDQWPDAKLGPFARTT